MSSVTRFIRQIPVSTTYYDAANAATNAYAFIPRGDNYVGNYPPGAMQLAAATAVAGTAGANLNGAINGAGVTNASILRDLGKTIYATIVGADGVTPSSPLVAGYFREVQLIKPLPIGSAPVANAIGGSLIGGPNGTNFGVVGESPGYLTFYIPVTVAGVRAVTNTTANFNVIAGGQM
jgi:hypothetical protein